MRREIAYVLGKHGIEAEYSKTAEKFLIDAREREFINITSKKPHFLSLKSNPSFDLGDSSGN